MQRHTRKNVEDVGELVSISQAARLRGVSPQAIDDLIKRGRLPAVEVAGRRLLRRPDVEGFKPETGGRGRRAHR
jgi:excisionase family DNA binding protein